MSSTIERTALAEPTSAALQPGGAAPTVAVIIPCYNEEVAIAQTVEGFRTALPNALIYVYDNNSADRSREAAAAAHAIVRNEPHQGKGNVVRRMFADIDADIYVLADGDATYDANAAPEMIAMMTAGGLDMVVGCRHDKAQAAYRPGHRFGNAMLTDFLAWMFGRAFNDTLSGYRVFSRRFVKTFPSLSSGFEIETEINVHALTLRMPVGELETFYKERIEGSASKLRTYSDGFRILGMMLSLFRQDKPATFFAIVAGIFLGVAAILFVPIAITFVNTGQVPRLPTAVLCTGLVILAMLSAACGLILDTVTHGRREVRRLAYLAYKAPHA